MSVQDAIANDLVAVPAVYLADWMEALRGIRAALIPQLSAIYRDAARPDLERSLATSILADYAADDAKVLAGLAMDADAQQFKVIYPKLAAQRDAALPLLLDEVKQKLSPDPTDPANEALAKQQANAAVALLRLGQADTVWPLLSRVGVPPLGGSAGPAKAGTPTGGSPGPAAAKTPTSDPRVRSYLIHRLAPLGADSAMLIQRLDKEPDVSIRLALLLALGEFAETALSLDARQTLLPKLQELYRTDPDPGLHAAAEWLLRKWDQATWLQQTTGAWAKDSEQQQKWRQVIQQSLASDNEKMLPQWYLNTQGQTMAVIPRPPQFLMGSPSTEAGRSDDETQHQERIGRTFAIATTPVTLEEYQSFDKSFTLPEKYAQRPDCPVVVTSWYQAADYCNWLSKEDGIDPQQWCYETDPQRHVVKLKAKYLSLAGYRLPTEAEVEYATRAGAATSRFYGETEELLPMYGWYLKDSSGKTWPVGRLKPNDFGLFDVQGNVNAWCLEHYRLAPSATGSGALEDNEDDPVIDPAEPRVFRGGSWYGDASLVRSAAHGQLAAAVPCDRCRLPRGPDVCALTRLVLKSRRLNLNSNLASRSAESLQSKAIASLRVRPLAGGAGV